MLVRRAIQSLVALTLVATAAACGSGGDSGDGGDGTTITLSGWSLELPPISGFQQVIDRYESETGNTVRVEASAFEGYRDRLFTQLGAGGGPTLVSVQDTDYGAAVDAGYAVDLTDKIERPAGDFVPLDSTTFLDDKRYGIIFATFYYDLIYNQSLLDEAGVDVPTTYAEFVDAVKALSDVPNQYGFTFRASPSNPDQWWIDLTTWVFGFGGSFTDEAGNPTLNSEPVVKAVEAMKSLIDEGLIPTAATSALQTQLLSEGKLAMYVDASPVYGAAAVAQNADLVDSIKFAQVPFDTKERIGTSIQLILNKNASQAEQEVAVDFLNFMLTPEMQELAHNAMAGQGVATDAKLTSKTLADAPYLSTLISSEGTKPFVPTGMEDVLAEVKSAVLGEIEKINAGQVSAQEGMDAAQAAVEDIMSK